MVSKRGLQRLSVATVLFVFFSIVLLSFISSSAPKENAVEKEYFAGEKLKLTFNEDYSLLLQAPSQNYSQEGKAGSFVFRLDEVGTYNLTLNSSSGIEAYSFYVKNEEELINGPDMTDIESHLHKQGKKFVRNAKRGGNADTNEAWPTSYEEKISEFEKKVVISYPTGSTQENLSAYTSVPEVANRQQAITLLREGHENIRFEGLDLDNDTLIDHITWALAGTSGQNETYTVSIRVLNVQSYPVRGGNWDVEFTTVGSANLTIRAIKGTKWSDFASEENDLQFLSVTCANRTVEAQWIGDSLFIENYSCDLTGMESSRVLSVGSHHLEFDFGGIKAYADNYAAGTRPAILAYGEGTVQIPRYRIWNGTGFGPELNASTVGGTIEWIRAAASPTRDEYMIAAADSTDDINVQIYSFINSTTACWHNGTTCNSVLQVNESSTTINRLKVDVAYEGISGDGIIVYSDNTNNPKYRTWNGSVWSGQQTVPETLMGGGVVSYVKMAEHPFSDEIALIMTNTSALDIMIWNGTAWACEPASLPVTTLPTGVFQHADLAYEQRSGDLFVVESHSSATDVNYTVKQNGTCVFTTSTTTVLAEQSEDVYVSTQYGSDYALIAQRDITGDDMQAIVWNGSAMLATSGNEASTYAETTPNQLIATTWAGTSDRGLVIYSDAAVSLNLDYLRYNKTQNAWEGGTTGLDATGITNFADEEQNIIAYSFIDENKSIIIVKDDSNQLWAKTYNAETNTWSNADGGAALEATAASAEFPSFDFAWKMYEDTISPQITIVRPQNTTYGPQDFPFVVNVTTDENSTVFYSTNGGLTNASMSTADNRRYNATITSLNGGSYVLRIYSNDSAGNRNDSVNVTFAVDASAPIVNVILPGAGEWFNSLPIRFNISLSENGTANYSLTYGLVNYTMTSNASGTGFNATNTSMSDGSYTASFYVQDIYHNRNFTTNVSFSVDRTIPLISYGVGSDESGSNLSRNWIYANVSLTETNFANITFTLSNLSGTVNSTTFTFVQRTINWTNLANGDYTFNVSVRDLANNFNSTASRAVVLDTVYPNVSFGVGTPGNGTTSPVTYLFVNVSVTELNFANITYFLYNETNGHTLVNRTSYANRNYTINWTGLNNNNVRYFYNVSVTDYSNNVNSTQTRTVTLTTVDIDPADITINRPEFNGINYSASSVIFNVSLNEAGDSCYYTLTNGFDNHTMQKNAGTNFNATNTSISNGQYSARFYCNDTAGNRNNANRSFGIDTIAPSTVTFVNPTPSNNTFTNITSVTFNITTVSDSIGSARIQIARGNTAVNHSMSCTGAGGSYACNYTNTSLGDGQYNYTAFVNDTASNLNRSETRILTIDTIAPTLAYGALTETDADNISRNNIYVNVSVNDINEANVTFTLINSTDTVNTTTFASGQRTINWTNLADDIYTFNVLVTDLALNSNSTATRTVRIDRRLPAVTYGVNTAANNSFIEQDFIYVNVSVTEANFANITYELYNTTNGQTLVNRTSYSSFVPEHNWTTLNDENQTYFYNVSVRDFANNENTSGTRTINLVDLTAPVIVIIEPQNTTYDTNESLSLTYEVNDTHSKTCWYALDGADNITLPGCAATTFDVSDGQQHTLRLYANDSVGNWNVSTVLFVANSTFIITDVYSVDRGSTSVNGITDVAINKTDQNKAFILFNTRTALSAPNAAQVTARFVNSTALRFENYAGGASAVEWEVVSGPDLSVRRAEQAYDTTTSQIDAGIAAVNTSASFVLVSNRLNSATNNQYSRGMWTARLLNSSTVRFDRASTGSSGNLSWRVIEWRGTEVQNGSLSTTAASAVVTLPQSVNSSRAFLVFSTRVTGGTGLDDLYLGGHLNDTSILFYRTGAGSTVNVEWFVVEWDRLEAERGNTAFGTISSANITISPLVNQSQSFRLSSQSSSGTGAANANAHVTSSLTNSTNLQLRKDITAQTNNLSWQAIEIVERDAPIVNLHYPDSGINFTSLTVTQFNYSVSENSSLVNCSLLGNWSGNFAINQTVLDTAVNIQQNFSEVNVSTDGFYIWNVECSDVYGNVGRNLTNNTFGAFVQPGEAALFNISQNAVDGMGNITLFWSAATHGYTYRIYNSSSLASGFSLLNETSALNYTDTLFSGSKRRFYKIVAVNPVGENETAQTFGAHVYSLSHTTNTRNWVAFPTNASYLRNANDSLNTITNATAFTMFNETTQRRVTCNAFSCPEPPLCTDTNCNFGLSAGRGYEVNVHAGAPTNLNWSMVGIVHTNVTVQLVKNSTSFGKNWIALYANTTLLRARNLLVNVSGADAVSEWEATNQTSRGFVRSPIPALPFIGQNFTLEIERGYEVAVNRTVNWSQV